MTTWWWVRHGPTHEKSFVGWRDVPADLSDTAALARLDGYLPKGALLVSSDLVRASATADALAKDRTRLPDAPELREFNFGDWDGMGFDEVAKRYPEASRKFWENPGDIAPPKGESWHQVAVRVAPFVDSLNSRFAGRDIIAVAHIGVIMTQIARAGGLGAKQVIAQGIDNLSVTRLGHKNGRWTTGAINHIP